MNGGHGGNLRELAQAAGVAPESILDFSASINPLGPPEWLRPVISAAIGTLVHYPDPDCAELAQAAAERYGVEADEVVAGNGSTELLYLIPRVLRPARALIPVPSYMDYARAAEAAGAAVIALPLRASENFALDFAALEAALAEHGDAGSLVIIGQPNNPTGMTCDPALLRALAERHTAATFLIDEAFADFVPGLARLAPAPRPDNLIVLLSLTKHYALPGLRLGCAVMQRDTAKRVRAAQPPWSVNALAQAVGAAALRDGDYLERTRAFVTAERERVASRLGELPGIHVFPGQANFLLFEIEHADLGARALAARLLRRGIAIRVCENFAGLGPRFGRVAIRTEDENTRLLGAMAQELSGAPAVIIPRRRPAIMFQGTSSNAGKSVLTAALCRIMIQDGWSVAPFKAQNMSLNSFVTRDGGEMGRAQVVQAQACRLDPDVRMNPILLKPSSDTGSQVIVRGKPVGNMAVLDYFRYKREAFATVKECYDALAAEHDAVVLEGAGSPAEVNLKSHDIVNMAMARHAGAPVLLVGDIDRGGVFASFVGSMEVFSEAERAQVAGFVVNRFRGKASLLGDALDYTLRHTGKPVLGVVPYLKDLGLPEEDSVGFKEGLYDDSAPGGAAVEIAVLDLPHISNFTDVEPLRIEPDVRLRVVRHAAELGAPDAVILPGSKNVIGDLAALHERGLDRAVAALAAAGRCEIIGICGGYQMLGASIADPYHLESERAECEGLGLLALTTTLERDKTLTRARARHIESGLEVFGYEIHHGQSRADGLAPALEGAGGEAMGALAQGGRIWGSYLHGIFDADPFRRWFIDRLRLRAGLGALGAVQARYDLEPALDRLAAAVRESLNIEDIYRMMGLR